MLSSRFLWNLYAGYAALILLTATIVGVLVTRQMEQESLAQIEQSLRAEALLLRSLASQGSFLLPDDEFQVRVRTVGLETGTRFTVIRLDGVVMADSSERPKSMDNHGQRPEIVAARSQGQGTATRHSATTGQTMMYHALPAVSDDGEVLGFVRTALPLAAVEARLGRMRYLVAIGAMVAALLGLAVAFAFARRVTRPILLMTAAAESLAAGDHDQRVTVDASDELGSLARSFNRMAVDLRDRIDTVERERHRLLAILGAMVEGVVALDGNEQVVHMNRAAGKVLQVSPEDSIGKRIWEVIRQPAVDKALRRAMEGVGNSSEARIAAEVTDRVIELHGAPLRDGGAVLVLYDVTELRQLEEVRRDFVANVSHELKTPVTAIVGLTETMLDDRDMESQIANRFLTRIGEQSRRMSVLVADLLALSRLEFGQGGLEQASLDLRTPILEALDSQRMQAGDRGLTLSETLPTTPLPVRGDEEALREATENLLTNAIRYTPDGGQVGVIAKRQGREVIVEVRDSGPGIEPQHQERIFERFYRVDQARSRELGGTGLGLAIVKHIILAHGGRVVVESSPGEGSVFRITLPLEMEFSFEQSGAL
ncbi:MAG: cell wall metabolism sensor histidine kinase WalK [Deltaproteobacteria bacterium]|nr:cell wall metabolism sensor histidine kinase WalK [Deltaproteobacteria bacterium]